MRYVSVTVCLLYLETDMFLLQACLLYLETDMFLLQACLLFLETDMFLLQACLLFFRNGDVILLNMKNYLPQIVLLTTNSPSVLGTWLHQVLWHTVLMGCLA